MFKRPYPLHLLPHLVIYQCFLCRLYRFRGGTRKRDSFGAPPNSNAACVINVILQSEQTLINDAMLVSCIRRLQQGQTFGRLCQLGSRWHLGGTRSFCCEQLCNFCMHLLKKKLTCSFCFTYASPASIVIVSRTYYLNLYRSPASLRPVISW